MWGHIGVSSYDISLEKQEVLVKGTIGYDDLHAKIAKTGKEVRIRVVSESKMVRTEMGMFQIRSGETLE